jgi:hypothetical protein
MLFGGHARWLAREHILDVPLEKLENSRNVEAGASGYLAGVRTRELPAAVSEL